MSRGPGRAPPSRHNRTAPFSWPAACKACISSPRPFHPPTHPPPPRLRQRQMRNMVAALLLSHGVPMIQMGDEYGHTKVRARACART